MSEKIEFIELSLETIIELYIEKCLKKKDWEIVAIDHKKGIVVLKRYNI